MLLLAFVSLQVLDSGGLFVGYIDATSASATVTVLSNGVTINGYYITPHLTPHLEGVLAEEKLTPVMVDTSEFEKSGGSVFCMKAFLP